MLPAVGRRAPLAHIIGEALETAGYAPQTGKPWNDERVLKAISQLAQEQPNSYGGLVIIVDEMGKILEGAAHDGHDIYLLQQLAEAASRSGRRLVFVGILHQAFDEYAQRLAREVKGPVELLAIEDGNHVANNRGYKWRLQSADWMAEQLGA